jgi:hypothetical protein
MTDLDLALSYETGSGAFVGVLLCLSVLMWALLRAPRYFRSVTSQRIFIASVVLRFVLICLSILGLFNPPAADFAWFEIDAARIAMDAQPAQISIAAAGNFEFFHSLFFRVFGASFFLADGLGLLAFACSVVALGRLIRLLKLEAFETWILVPFCFLPGSLLYLNYNTREVFQVLFLILAMHAIVEYRMRGKFRSLIAAALLGYAFAATHNRYIVVVPALLAIGVLLPSLMHGRIATWRRLAIFPLAVALILAMNYVSSSQGFQRLVADQGLINYVSDITYGGASLSARTQFPFLLSTASPSEFLLALPVMAVQFIFAPIFPLMIGSPLDLLPATDALVRVLFLYGTLRVVANTRSPAQLRDAALFFLISYLVFCGVSLLGTLNVGTQQRHQAKIEWVLLLGGAPVVAAMFSRRAAALWQRSLAPVAVFRPFVTRRRPTAGTVPDQTR